MDTRREFLKKAAAASGGAGLMHILPPAIARALAIDPAPGSTFLDAEHVVFLMQENRSFDHAYGTLQGVRGFNDPRAIRLPDKNPVWLQTNKEGETYAPFRLNIKATNATWMSSLPHSWSNQVDARNEGKYDKWLDAKQSGNPDYAHMPLTLGYYTREDIPFYYALADAFTICDQHFCSSLTGTTPNRLYFWSGTIRERADENVQANVWNEDADHYTMVNWTTFPERLEEQGISWKVYQNELYLDTGFKGEEEGWLSNFGDNPLEYFKQYQVKLSAAYIDNLPEKIARLEAELKKREHQLAGLPPGSKEAENMKNEIAWFRKDLAIATNDQKIYTKEKYAQLSVREKNLHDKAFSDNRNDPFYRQLSTLQYNDGTTHREVQVPKGDVLHQFREDVKNNKLPAVSWIAAPENFSDHPSSAWYGAWYISEVMDILTSNPAVWKKTIFVLTYDENDGYFDHVPPFIAPHPHRKDTGLVSKGIDTGIEYVANADQQSIRDLARESSIGLGYRVPLVIASPWSRGGWVNSQVFDHTSSLQFLEKWLAHKQGKKIEEPNISAWRRTVCGDLTSVFRPYNGEKIKLPSFIPRNPFITLIHKAKFKKPPSNYKKLNAQEIALVNRQVNTSFMPRQEKGIRSSCALPYELYADSHSDPDKKTVVLTFEAGDQLFGASAAGSPFQVYAPGLYRQEAVRTWSYAVAAGDRLQDSWPLSDFENGHYHLQVYGPNGFFRKFAGSVDDPAATIKCGYKNGDIVLTLTTTGTSSLLVKIKDNAYKTRSRILWLTPESAAVPVTVILPLEKSFSWYDFTVSIKDHPAFRKRFAGRVETGQGGKTDPLMGRIL